MSSILSAPLDSRAVCLPASCLSQELWTASLCVEILLQSASRSRPMWAATSTFPHIFDFFCAFQSVIQFQVPISVSSSLICWPNSILQFIRNDDCRHHFPFCHQHYHRHRKCTNKREYPMFSVMLSAWHPMRARCQFQWECGERHCREVNAFCPVSCVCYVHMCACAFWWNWTCLIINRSLFLLV